MDVHGRTDSAVLAPLYADDAGDLHAVFTRRRHDLSRHAGEISFPGGRQDPGETLMETALREAHEEVGLPPEAVDVLGALEPTPTFVTNYAIYPFVGLIEPGFEWVVGETEVAEVLELRLSDLRAGLRRAAARAQGDPVPDADVRGRRAPDLGRHRPRAPGPPGAPAGLDAEQAVDGGAGVAEPRIVVARIGGEDLQGDLPCLGGGARDVLALRQRAFVDDAADRRVDELLPQHPQAAAVQLRHRQGAHQPADHGDAGERVHQRPDAVRVADVRLGAGRADRVRVRRRARGAAHGVAGGHQVGRQRAAPAAAGHDQDAGHLLAAASPVAAARLGQLLLVPADARLDLLLVAVRQPPAAADRVLRLDHLRDVVDVVLSLDVGRARRLPVEVVARRAIARRARAGAP